MQWCHISVLRTTLAGVPAEPVNDDLQVQHLKLTSWPLRPAQLPEMPLQLVRQGPHLCGEGGAGRQPV